LKELFIDSNPLETRIALVEDSRLTELWMERSATTSTVGNVYKGVVQKVLPGLEAAFVGIGLGRDGFLPFNDISAPLLELGANPLEARVQSKPLDEASDGEEPVKRGRREKNRGLKKGQELLVQVTKEPIAGKGPRVTSWVSLAGRFCVLLPGEDQIGISQRIGSSEERQRLKAELRKILPKGFGVVARTAAGNQDPKGLQREIKELVARWQDIVKRGRKAKAPSLLHAEPPQVWGVLRDVAAYGIERITVDSKPLFKEIQGHLGKIDPGWRKKLRLHEGGRPAFEEHGLEKQITQAMLRQIWLKSGGRLIIEQTEALTVIDVNSGRFVGKRAAEETVFKVNLEAAAEIARQLRLRDIGGIIVIDFIDMESKQRRAQVLEELKRSFAEDRSRPEVSGFSDLGLVEISRKRTKPSLWHTSSETCPACHGTGRIFHPSALAARIMRGLASVRQSLKGAQVELLTNPALADYIEENIPREFAQLGRELDCRIYLEEDDALPMERFIVRRKQDGKQIDLGDFSIDSGLFLD